MAKQEIKIEICRSFSRKLNLGHYETCDFFASAKEETTQKQAKKVSEKLTKFVEEEVMNSVAEYWFKNTPEPETPKINSPQASQIKQELSETLGEEEINRELEEL